MESKIAATIELKCPRCRTGKMFSGSVFNIKQFDKMHEQCPNCNLKFEVEPGFWYGAMFVSYGFSILILIVLGATLYYFFNDPSIWVYITAITLVSLLAVPLNFRLSRSVFLHLFGFIKFEPKYYRKNNVS